MKIKTKTIETIRVRIEVLQKDIDNARCGLISLCMEKVAIERGLRKIDPRGGDHKVRVDGGNFKFSLRGWRWIGIAPKQLKMPLITYDKERRARARAEKLGIPFVSKVKPHSYYIEAHKTTKVTPFTRERQEQVNEARRRRVAEGRPDRKYDLRYRVEGLGAV